MQIKYFLLTPLVLLASTVSAAPASLVPRDITPQSAATPPQHKPLPQNLNITKRQGNDTNVLPFDPYANFTQFKEDELKLIAAEEKRKKDAEKKRLKEEEKKRTAEDKKRKKEEKNQKGGNWFGRLFLNLFILRR